MFNNAGIAPGGWFDEMDLSNETNDDVCYRGFQQYPWACLY